MKYFSETSTDTFFGRRLYIAIALLSSIAIYPAFNSYVNSIRIHEDESVAAAATAFFVFGIFGGRFAVLSWTKELLVLPRNVVVVLSVILVFCTICLFLHVDFPLNGRAYINLLLFWLPVMFISVTMGILMKIIHTVNKNQLKAAENAATHSKSELSLLQSQLSPHFLFNTLNNLYGLSITQHERIPPLLLKLSALLRYSVYDAGDTYVPLKDELAYINNYMEFERIRIGERLVLSTNIEVITNPDLRIAPMLLIVFLENAFKHGKNTADDKIFIEVTMKLWAKSILFSIKNSTGSEGAGQHTMNKSSGFGLPNVTKRLELLYPNEHELTITKDNNSYLVMLQLKLK
ncbi:sensor histidine kinase [Pedobacter sp. PWIIR3]